MHLLTDLIFELNTISQIGKGDKVNTMQRFIDKEKGGIMQSVVRFMNRDSRQKTLMRIARPILSVCDYAELLLESVHLTDSSSQKYNERAASLNDIRKALLGAKIGVVNLCATYADDANFQAEVQPLFDSIDSSVHKINRWMYVNNMHDHLQ